MVELVEVDGASVKVDLDFREVAEDGEEIVFVQVVGFVELGDPLCEFDKEIFVDVLLAEGEVAGQHHQLHFVQVLHLFVKHLNASLANNCIVNPGFL